MGEQEPSSEQVPDSRLELPQPFTRVTDDDELARIREEYRKRRGVDLPVSHRERAERAEADDQND